MDHGPFFMDRLDHVWIDIFPGKGLCDLSFQCFFIKIMTGCKQLYELMKKTEGKSCE